MLEGERFHLPPGAAETKQNEWRKVLERHGAAVVVDSAAGAASDDGDRAGDGERDANGDDAAAAQRAAKQDRPFVHVCEDFTSSQFQRLFRQRKRIVHPQWLIELQKGMARKPPGLSGAAMRSTCFEGMVFAFSGLSKEKLKECRMKVEQLSGECVDKLSEYIGQHQGNSGGVHLVAATAMSNAYGLARRLQVPIVTPQFVDECWKRCRVMPCGDFKTACFAGTVVCITGFTDISTRKRFEQVVGAQGGRYQGELNTNVTHLVAKRKEGPKYEYAKEQKIRIVSEQWFAECVRQGVLLDPNRYPVPEGAARAHRYGRRPSTVANTVVTGGATANQTTSCGMPSRSAGTHGALTGAEDGGEVRQDRTVQMDTDDGGGAGGEVNAHSTGVGADDEGDDGGSSSDGEVPTHFESVRASILGFGADETLQLRQLIVGGGGTYLSEMALGFTTHVVVGPSLSHGERVDVAASAASEAALATTAAWVRASSRAECALDLDDDDFKASLPGAPPAHDAAPAAPRGRRQGTAGGGRRTASNRRGNSGTLSAQERGAKAFGANWTIVVSRYEDSDREDVADMAHRIGASSDEDLKRSKATHLVVPYMDLENRKVKRALDWNLTIVTIDWLRACLKARKELPTDGFVPPEPPIVRAPAGAPAPAAAPAAVPRLPPQPTSRPGRSPALRSTLVGVGATGVGAAAPIAHGMRQGSQRSLAHGSGSAPSSVPGFEKHDPWSAYDSQMAGENPPQRQQLPPPAGDVAAHPASVIVGSALAGSAAVGKRVPPPAAAAKAHASPSAHGGQARRTSGGRTSDDLANALNGLAGLFAGPKSGGRADGEVPSRDVLNAPTELALPLSQFPAGGDVDPSPGRDAEADVRGRRGQRKRSRQGEEGAGGDSGKAEAAGRVTRRRSNRRRQSSPPAFASTQADTQVIGYENVENAATTPGGDADANVPRKSTKKILAKMRGMAERRNRQPS